MERPRAESEKAARPQRTQAGRPRDAREPDRAAGSGRRLVCARCGRPITTDGDRIEIDGLHQHTQINPHGVIWTFGCFASAPGCAPVGSPSREFTWFAGHWWQIEQCGRCGFHLGWLFASADRRFHGLIVGRVVDASGGDSPA